MADDGIPHYTAPPHQFPDIPSSMTPLERAARALHKDYVEGRIRMGVSPSDLPTWEDLGPDGEFSFYAPARVVIEAIREPSEAMTLRVDEAANGHGDYIFRTMIDALLEEH